jgi:hypothetical protein
MSTAPDANSPPSFTVGANLPWLHYGIDFGANAWRPSGGVGHGAEPGHLDAAFARLIDAGVDHVRWFLLCDGRAGIRFTGRGRPEGLDDFVFRDMDAALERARQRGIRVMFVLLDFLWCAAPRAMRGVQMGGRSSVLRDRSTRQALLDTVFLPLLERYADHPQIFAWDIINEPEWITSLPLEELRAFLAGTVALAHATARQPVTVGSAGTRWRDVYRGLGLDFYQVHWYDSLKRQPPLETHVDRLGFDRPVVLGEFPTRGSRHSSAHIIETARAAGYAGAFYWSLMSNDDASGHFL